MQQGFTCFLNFPLKHVCVVLAELSQRYARIDHGIFEAEEVQSGVLATTTPASVVMQHFSSDFEFVCKIMKTLVSSMNGRKASNQRMTSAVQSSESNQVVIGTVVP